MEIQEASFPTSSDASVGDFVGDIWNGIKYSLIPGLSQAEANRVNQDIAQSNLDLQYEQYNYQKWLNQQSWLRDDNAIRRRMSDLSAAGLNPLLAVGSPAANSSVSGGSAPQMDYKRESYKGKMISDMVAQAMQMDQMQFTNANLRAQAAYTQAMTRNADVQTESIDANTGKAYMTMWNDTLDAYKKGAVNNNVLRNVAMFLSGRKAEAYSDDIDRLNEIVIDAIWSRYGLNVLGDAGLSGLANGGDLAQPGVFSGKTNNGKFRKQYPHESSLSYELEKMRWLNNK